MTVVVLSLSVDPRHKQITLQRDSETEEEKWVIEPSQPRQEDRPYSPGSKTARSEL